MKKTQFSKSQIIKVLQEHKGGRKADEFCRELEICRATFYQWKYQYGDMEVSEVKRLKELEEENAGLRKIH